MAQTRYWSVLRANMRAVAAGKTRKALIKSKPIQGMTIVTAMATTSANPACTQATRTPRLPGERRVQTGERKGVEPAPGERESHQQKKWRDRRDPGQ